MSNVDPTGEDFWDVITGFFSGLGCNDDGDYQDANDYYGASLLGSAYADFVATHDIVYDFSLSAGYASGTIGYSYIQGNASGYTAGYVHVGGGASIGLLPVNGSVSIGIVDNASNPDAYNGNFLDISGVLGAGGDYCAWPGGSSATSITLATNVGGGVRYDYYILVNSHVNGANYYDLYQR